MNSSLQDYVVTLYRRSCSDVKKRSLDEGEATKKDTDTDSSPSAAKKAKVDLVDDKSSKPTEKATEKKAENGDHKDTDKDEVSSLCIFVPSSFLIQFTK